MSLRSFLRSVRTLGRGVFVGVPDAEAGRDPIALFHEWMDAAKASGIVEPTAMTLATASPDGHPTARTVLLKGVDDRGFVFFTNYDSRKGIDLDANPRAALVFHWSTLVRQVLVEGTVERISREESEVYFVTRPRGSQIGAWASDQSRPLASREDLQQRFKDIEKKYAGRDVDLPPFWGGYVLRPVRIEFWQGRANRLHDRMAFHRADGGWTATRLNP